MIWLGERAGFLSDWVTQQWVRGTGRQVDLARAGWLDGPVGKTTGIGAGYFQDLVRSTGLSIRSDGCRGLLPDFSAVAGPECAPGTVHRDVRDFYEATSEYSLDAWAEWCGAWRPFGRALHLIFSRRLQQLNVPLSALDPSQGMTSEVLPVLDRDGGHRFTAWVRTLVGSGNVVYAGAYSLTTVPGYAGVVVRVVFPLPNGNAVVLMKPVSAPDGSFAVLSSGRRFGDPGFYFTVHGTHRVWARYVSVMKESIRVYASGGGEVRADHVLRIWGATFLRLHYRMRRR